ncbi:hypothetical protein Tco_0501549, partial [Tanacetum coccineum]
HQELYDALLNSILLDEAIAREAANPNKVLRKKDRGDDQDPSAGSNQGKKKRRKGIDVEPSKKSFASMESSKGKTLPKTSKTGKSVTAEEPVEKHVHEMEMDVKEPALDNTVDEADLP